MNDLVNYFKLLSDETRLRIVLLLVHHDLCVCQLCGIMQETQPKISKHLAKLRDLGVIIDERRGQFIFYRLASHEDLFQSILRDIQKYQGENPKLMADFSRLEQADSYIEGGSCKWTL